MQQLQKLLLELQLIVCVNTFYPKIDDEGERLHPPYKLYDD